MHAGDGAVDAVAAERDLAEAVLDMNDLLEATEGAAEAAAAAKAEAAREAAEAAAKAAAMAEKRAAARRARVAKREEARLAAAAGAADEADAGLEGNPREVGRSVTVWYKDANGEDEAWGAVVIASGPDAIRVRFERPDEDDPDKEMWVSRADDEWAFGELTAKPAALLEQSTPVAGSCEEKEEEEDVVVGRCRSATTTDELRPRKRPRKISDDDDAGAVSDASVDTDMPGILARPTPLTAMRHVVRTRPTRA